MALLLGNSFRRTNPQNSSQIIQRAVDEKVQWMLADNVKYAQSTGLGKPPRSKGLKHLKQRRNKAMKMQDEWNRIVTENVRLLKRTREIALRTQLPPVRKQMTHKSLNEPFKQRFVTIASNSGGSSVGARALSIFPMSLCELTEKQSN